MDNILTSTPENFAASEFSISLNPREISLIIGQTRHILDPETGQPHKQVKDWHVSYSLSPTSAKQLSMALSRTLEIYEESFGSIPEDPNAKVEFTPHDPV